MTTYGFDEAELEALKGKTILITGCATGIGRETAKIAHRNGANLALADWNDSAAISLIEELDLKENVIFRKVDVSKWDDVLETFQAAWKKFGIIHAVLSNAGVNKEDVFTDEIDPSTGKLMAPDLKSVEINLFGHFYVAKCAVHYFAKWPETHCQIVLTGSAASFIDTPPLHLYCAAKAGVLGFMRSLRTQLVKKNITVNMVAPWLTSKAESPPERSTFTNAVAVTPMLLPSFMEIWGDLPANQPPGVAHALLLPIVRPEVNGKALFVAGHQIIDFEDKLHETQPLWMGKQLSADVDEGQLRLIP